MAELPDANTNPWYVLMTLYGEQKTGGYDRTLAENNRRVWNAWACQNWNKERRDLVFSNPNSDSSGAAGWSKIEADVKRLHKAEMEKRSSGNGSFAYCGFPDKNAKIDCSGIKFVCPLALTSTIFQQSVDFSGAHFEDEVIFFGSNFLGGGNFRSAAFKSGAVFCDVDFQRAAEFRLSTFKGSASFRQGRFSHFADFRDVTAFAGADFAGAEFKLRADFRKSFWGGHANFNEAKFLNIAIFENASFQDISTFAKVNFDKFVDFSGATFLKDVVFGSASFTGNTNFANAKFTQSANFQSTEFGGSTKFKEAQFGKLDSDEISVPDFTEASFAKVVSFRGAEFVSHYPVLEGTQFREGVVLSAKAAFWPVAGKGATDLDESETELAKESCAALRHALAKQGMPEEEHFFFRREMRFAAQIGGLWQRLPYQVFGAVSDFGQSIWRPAVGLLALWAIGALLYTVSYAWGAFDDGQQPREILFGFGLSFANIFKFLGLQRSYFDVDFTQSLNPWLQVMGGVQTVVGFLLLFFLGLGLRTRFRMR